MVVAFFHLVGIRENLDKTIKTLLSDNWVAGNVIGTITPRFESDTEEPDHLAVHDEGVINGIYVRLNARQRTQNEGSEANGDGIHIWATTLIISVYGETLSIMTSMEDEVNRILWENQPNNNTRLLKSDATSSEVSYFEKTEIEFERIDVEDIDEENDVIPNSEGILVCVYQKSKQ